MGNRDADKNLDTEPRQTLGVWSRTGANQSMVQASADGIVAVDQHGVVRLCNPAAETLLAHPAGELVGSPFRYPLVINQTSEIGVTRADGDPRVVEMRVTTTTWQGERLYVAALRDVTTLKHAQKNLEEALEHRTHVAGVAAHELRTPVAEIKLLVQVLRDRWSHRSEEQNVENLDQIADRIDHLQALMHKLLTASMVDAGASGTTPESVHVLEVLLEQLAQFGQKATDVIVSCSQSLVALVNRHELAEMLANYLENAFAYGDPPVDVQATEQAGQVAVRVSDRGPGVPDAFVPHLFERFSREPAVGQQTEGTGLGLWIVRALARKNGGDAWYEPGDGAGACFCLRLQGTPTA